jgi:hypothetical protein
MHFVVETLRSLMGVQIDVVGFDRGVGLPKPQDHRDTPNLAVEGFFRMDEKKLRGRLRKAQLILGSLEDTIGDFLSSRPAPIAFISVDLVLYSSTMQALRLFDAHPDLLLPRVHCYFDDIFGFSLGDCNGERLAISEFNGFHEMRKLSQLYGLRYFVDGRYANSSWVEQFWMAHVFDHPLYGHYDGLVKRGTLKLDEWD